MKKLIVMGFLLGLMSWSGSEAKAQGVVILPSPETELDAQEATEAATEATASGVVKRITERSSDLTETQGESRGKLAQFILSHPVGDFSITNFLRWSIRSAVMAGVPANTIVLLLMFPIVTAMIAASRHLIGLRGFGIFTPAIVSIGLLATGITTGFILIFSIILVATLARMLIRGLKLPYLPRTSLLLWAVTLWVVILLVAAPYLNLNDLTQLSIFPILLMVLLAETFMEVQSRRSRDEAIEMTLETLLLAVVAYFVMNLEMVQLFVLLNTEAVLLIVAIFNIFLGKFSGLRLMEYWRFRSLLD